MKVKFTKASNRDGDNVVTCRIPGLKRKQGKQICLIIKARWSDNLYNVLFTSNRKDGSTLKTIEWPKRFAKPTVGSPVEYEVECVVD
jgi:hypothetical protein